MAATPSQRKLAAILAIDVVGFSRAMERNEADTLAKLKKLRAECIDPAVDAAGGRTVKLMGDGALVEFSSVVDAMNCAIAIQSKQSSLRTQQSMQLRIGVNLGDVVMDGEDIYGDGVNVAARLESLAPEGGVCASDIAYQIARPNLGDEFVSLGERKLKNIEAPVKVWTWQPDRSPADALATAKGPALPDKPSIVVLPFDNLSADPDQDYFVDGMTEDIITDLSGVGELFVIARHSAFQYRGRHVGHAQIGRELGVRYIVEGSVRKAGQRLRTNAQLIDAQTGYHLWAKRFDRTLDDLFELQDELANSIVGELKFALGGSARAPVARQGTSSLEAYDHYLRARASLHFRTIDGTRNAQSQLERAIEIEPNFASALAELANCHRTIWVYGWDSDDVHLERSTQLARMAVEIDPELPLARARLSASLLFCRDYEGSIREIENAIELDRNYSEAFAQYGHILNFSGNHDRALDKIQTAGRLDPVHSFHILFYQGFAEFNLEWYEVASETLTKSKEMNPTFPGARMLLAASHSLLGKYDDAIYELRALARTQAHTSIERVARHLPFRRDIDRDRLLNALRAVGLPER